MPVDVFLRRKKDILSKNDKSFKGNIDEKIRSLCDRINSLKDCYTTSSCSGRVVLMIDEDEKKKDLMLKLYHNLISFNELKNDLNEMIETGKNIRFKMEPCALHVACRNFEDAQKICEQARFIGWRKAGIISSGRRFIIEMNSTEKMDFPIIRNESSLEKNREENKKTKILVDDNFLKIIVEDANKKMKKGWEKIEKLEREI